MPKRYGKQCALHARCRAQRRAHRPSLPAGLRSCLFRCLRCAPWSAQIFRREHPATAPRCPRISRTSLPNSTPKRSISVTFDNFPQRFGNAQRVGKKQIAEVQKQTATNPAGSNQRTQNMKMGLEIALNPPWPRCCWRRSTWALLRLPLGDANTTAVAVAAAGGFGSGRAGSPTYEHTLRRTSSHTFAG